MDNQENNAGERQNDNDIGASKIIVNTGAKVICNGKVEANAVFVHKGGYFEINNPVDEEGNYSNGIKHLFLGEGATLKIGDIYIHGPSPELFNKLNSSSLEVVVGEAQHIEAAGDVPIETTGDVFA